MIQKRQNGFRAPRVLEVDLVELERAPAAPPRPEPWASADERLERVGSWSGAALAVALLLDALDRSAELPFVVAAGDAVRRGLPTAARATVAARAPLSGLYSDGQVGGELGRRLASFADALALRGKTALPGAVLRIGAEGELELLSCPELAGLDARATGRALAERFGQSGALCVGPAGERGVRFASLANGEDPPSFVGRGGLGAAFGALGLKALVVTAPPVPEALAAEELQALLSASPRLQTRGQGGTLELVQAFAARGDLRARNYREPLARRSVERLARGAAESARERRGCRGCPTPCGWVFEGPGGGKQGARFSAVYALGPNLGLDDFQASLGLLEACDRAGVDAKEMGASLAVLAAARERGSVPGAPLWGDAEALIALVDEMARGEGEGARLAVGSEALARGLGLPAEARAARGQAARPEANLAVVLGQCVSCRGADPMRSFPFLAGEAADRERLEELLDPLGLPEGAEDPRRPEGKGRVVWWHENFALGIDTAGFCAFSAAGLLADGALGLDELARRVLPESALEVAVEPGRALLAVGASVALLQRELCRRLGAGPAADRPAWAASLLELAGMWDEYATLRGLDESGRARPAALALVGGEALLDVGLDSVEEPFVLYPRQRPIDGRPQAPGRCTVRTFGALAASIGPESRLLLHLPARMEEVLDQLVRRKPSARPLLLRDGRPVPAIYRAGKRLDATDWIEDGDELDFVLAIGGG